MTLDLNAIKARVEAATEGPWYVDLGGDGPVKNATISCARWRGFVNSIDLGEDHATAEFIAHARQDIPALLQEIERLTAERDGWLATAARHKHSLAALQAQHDTLRGVVREWQEAKKAHLDAIAERRKGARAGEPLHPEIGSKESEAYRIATDNLASFALGGGNG